jgi:MFS transporter, DHA3 family, macrolide efflux protein
MKSRYLSILSQKNFSLLWFGQIVSQFGDRLTQIALVGLVSRATMSTSSLAVVMSIAIIPVFLISPVSGVYIDRWNKRQTMYTSDLVRGAIILAIPFFLSDFNSLLPVYILLFFSFCAGRFFIPAKMAYIPEIVKKEDIFLANSLVSITATIAAVLGIGLGGIIVEKYTVAIALKIDAATFFASALAIFLIRKRDKVIFDPKDILDITKEVATEVKKSFTHELKEGFKYIFTASETKYAFKIFLFLFSYVGGLYVVLIRFIQITLNTITKDLGFTAVSIGAGLFLGSLLYGRIAHKISIRKIINIAIFSSSLFLIFFVIFLKHNPTTITAVTLSFVLGILTSPAFIGINSLIHSESDTKLLGRIFSGLEFTSHLGFLVVMFIASILADIFNPFTIVISIGIIGALCAALFIIGDDTRKRK